MNWRTLLNPNKEIKSRNTPLPWHAQSPCPLHTSSLQLTLEKTLVRILDQPCHLSFDNCSSTQKHGSSNCPHVAAVTSMFLSPLHTLQYFPSLKERFSISPLLWLSHFSGALQNKTAQFLYKYCKINPRGSQYVMYLVLWSVLVVSSNSWFI